MNTQSAIRVSPTIDGEGYGMLTPIIAPSTPHLRIALSGRLEGIRRAAQALFDGAGGTQGVENLFRAHGLAHLPQAWAQGYAHILSPHQLHTVIGRDGLAKLALLADLSLAQTLAGLSDYLPNYFAHEHQSRSELETTEVGSPATI